MKYPRTFGAARRTAWSMRIIHTFSMCDIPAATTAAFGFAPSPTEGAAEAGGGGGAGTLPDDVAEGAGACEVEASPSASTSIDFFRTFAA